MERETQTRRHRITLWPPFCELLTHVEAVPSAQRDGETRGTSDGITLTSSATGTDERRMSKWASTTFDKGVFHLVSIIVFSCMAHVLTKTGRL